MLVIHIGLKKSGSASIQTFLAANQDGLAALSIDYPVVGRKRQKDHHNLFHEVRGSARFKPKRGTLEDLAKALAESDMQRAIISSELFEGATVAEVATIKASLDDAGRDFRIVLIVRDLLDLIPSSYAQKIRYGLRLFDFETFFEERMRDDRVDYFETASRWGDAFGWDRLEVRPLDKRFQKNGDLIDDFLDAAGVDFTDPRIAALPRPGLINAAAGWKTLEAIRGLHAGRHQLSSDHPLVRTRDLTHNRRQGVAIEEASRTVGDSLSWNIDRGRYYTRAQAEEVLDVYSKAITALNSRLPVALPAPSSLEDRGFVEREFVPDVSRIPPDELHAFYDGLADLMVGGKFKEREMKRADLREQWVKEQTGS